MEAEGASRLLAEPAVNATASGTGHDVRNLQRVCRGQPCCTKGSGTLEQSEWRKGKKVNCYQATRRSSGRGGFRVDYTRFFTSKELYGRHSVSPYGVFGVHRVCLRYDCIRAARGRSQHPQLSGGSGSQPELCVRGEKEKWVTARCCKPAQKTFI